MEWYLETMRYEGGFGFKIDGRGKPLELARLGYPYWYVHASLELQSTRLLVGRCYRTTPYIA